MRLRGLGFKIFVSYLIIIAALVTVLAVTAEWVTLATTGAAAPLDADSVTVIRGAVKDSILLAAPVAVLVAGALSLFVTRRVMSPIGTMIGASQRIAGGHYNERVPVAAGDELGDLARHFNRMAAALERNEAIRRQLVGDVAHELRTPLSSIKGYMEGLLDGVLPPDHETFRLVWSEANRLQRLVHDLQEVTRAETGPLQLARVPVDLAGLIAAVVATLRPQFADKGVGLAMALPPGLPAVPADPDRLQQVLTNLLGNALTYTPNGGTVTVQATAGTDQVTVTVVDTGIGIAPEHLPHLFTRFYRVDRSRSRAGGGSGIGLTIVQHLVAAHGGRVWADSPGPGLGSRFHFTLPVRRTWGTGPETAPGPGATTIAGPGADGGER